MSRESTPAEKLQEIREWFERHRKDYSPHHNAPPFVWSEYFEWLLRHATKAIDAKDGR